MTIDFAQMIFMGKDILPVLIPGALSLSVSGFFPKIGPGRALWIGIRSRFALNAYPESIRFQDLERVKSYIFDKNFGQGYLVVTGQKGVGKTCLVNTALNKTSGVIRIKALPNHTEDVIINNALISNHFNFVINIEY